MLDATGLLRGSAVTCNIVADCLTILDYNTPYIFKLRNAISKLPVCRRPTQIKHP